MPRSRASRGSVQQCSAVLTRPDRKPGLAPKTALSGVWCVLLSLLVPFEGTFPKSARGNEVEEARGALRSSRPRTALKAILRKSLLRKRGLIQ